jgi:hypothetical protein
MLSAKASGIPDSPIKHAAATVDFVIRTFIFFLEEVDAKSTARDDFVT